MKFRHSFFAKFLVVLLAILIPIVALYTYSNRLSVKIVEDNIESSTLSRLSYLLGQIDSRMNQLKFSTMLLIQDNDIQMFKHINDLSKYEQIALRGRIMQKLNLQITGSAWPYDITLYSPMNATAVSADSPTGHGSVLADDRRFAQWEYENGQFSYGFSDSLSDPGKLLLKFAFPKTDISQMLDQFKAAGQGDPFFYSASGDVIVNKSQSLASVHTIIQALPGEVLGDRGKLNVDIHGKQYVAHYSKSEISNWYLIDYVPVEEVLEPINKSMTMFYITLGLLILMAVMSIYYLYMKVRLPIKELIQQMYRLKRGDYKARIVKSYPNEFGVISTRFNEMSEQIGQLIEQVYLHEIRYRDAVMKQLQSQINPHFLYNCFYFITSMAKLGENDAIVAMSVNLGDYYRYTTRVENQIVSLEDELRLVNNYLSIQKLRMNRMNYELDVPAEMLGVRVPRLLVQPIVENAIIHGFEKMPGQVTLRVIGTIATDRYTLSVEDNGAGMTEEELEALTAKLARPMELSTGCGLWNINERVKHHFGEGSGIDIVRKKEGGVKVSMYWRRKVWAGEESGHV